MKADFAEQNYSLDNGNTRNNSTVKKVLKTICLALCWVCLVSYMFSYSFL